MAGAAEILEYLESDFPNTVKERSKLYSIKDAYKTISWVYACTNLIADCISGVPFELFRLSRKKEEIDLKPNDPAITCFYPPKKGEISTLSEMIKMQFLHMGLFGESFGQMIVKGSSRAVGIDIYNPLLVTPEYTKDGSAVQYWKVQPVMPSGAFGMEKKVKPDDMIQWKYPNPYNPFRGMSPLMAARMAIEQDMNMATWNAGFFQNGIRNPIALMLKQTFNDSQRTEFMNRLRRNFSGFVKGQLPLLVEGGVDVKVLANTIKDLDFVEGKSLTREELCAVYGCPPAQVGIFRYANYANSKEQRNIFYLNTLRSKMTYYRDVFQQSILNEYFPGIFCDFDWDDVDVFKEDPVVTKTNAEVLKIKAEAASVLYNMGYDQRQISIVLDDENYDPGVNAPDPSLEEEEEDEEEGEVEPGPEGSPEDEAEDAAEGEAEAASAGRVVFAKAKETTNIYASPKLLREKALAVSEALEPSVGKLDKFITSYAKQLSSSVAKGATNISAEFWGELWEETVKSLLDNVYFEGFVSVANDLGKRLHYDKASEKHQELIQRYLGIPKNLLSAIETDLNGNSNRAKTAKAILELPKKLRAERAVRSAFCAGREDAMAKAGVMEYTWCCAGDHHQNLHGTSAGFPFGFGDAKLTYPGESSPTGEVCTCVTFPKRVARK